MQTIRGGGDSCGSRFSDQNHVYTSGTLICFLGLHRIQTVAGVKISSVLPLSPLLLYLADSISLNCYKIPLKLLQACHHTPSRESHNKSKL